MSENKQFELLFYLLLIIYLSCFVSGIYITQRKAMGKVIKEPTKQ